MEPIRLQRVIWPSEHASNIEGVVFRRVEIGIVSDKNRHAHLNVACIVMDFLLDGLLLMFDTSSVIDLECLADFFPIARSEFDESIERFLAEDVVVNSRHERSSEDTHMLKYCQINHSVADPRATMNLS